MKLMEGFLHKLRSSLQKGRGVSLPDDHKAALHLIVGTIFSNDVSTLEDLLATSGFDVNSTFHRTQRSMLQVAAQANAYECLCLLLRKGADVNMADTSGTTAFLVASRNGYRKIVKKLISMKEVTITSRDMSGLTGVHWMAASGRTDCLADSISHIEDVDMLDEQGQTSLHFAAKNGHNKAMELLIEHGASIDLPSNSGDTPLHFACSNGQLPGLTLLLSKGAKYKPNNKRQLPLELAVEGGHQGAVRLLVEHCHDMISHLTQLTVKEGLDEAKVLTLLCDVTVHFNCLDSVLMQLAEIVTNAGLKLLTSFSIIDVELFMLMRCVTVLTGLCKKASVQQIKRVQQSMLDVWSSMEGWFNLLGEKISSLPPNMEHLSTDEAATKPSECNTPTSPVKGKDTELHTICPRISCVLQAYYSISRLGVSDDSNSSTNEFLQFIIAHDNEIEFLIKRNPTAVFDHFDFLLTNRQLNNRFFKFIKIQTFSDRREWFHKQLTKQSVDVFSPASMEDILISRDSLFISSCHQLLRRDPNDLKNNIMIKFSGEEGLGRGVVKDWFDTLSQELLNPNYALFTVSPDGSTFQPNPQSSVNPDHLNYFNFAGQIIGLALYHQQLLNVYFTRSFYKHILGIPVNYRDVESIDPEYARNLQWILDNDITNLGLDLTFSVENNVFGVRELIPLKEGGAKLLVTEANKEEYVQLVTELKMTRSIQPQIDSFLLGFHKFIPEALTKIFDEYELEILVSGLPDINMADWKDNTEYIGYSSTDPVIQWFWEILEEMTREERVQILQFVTGSSRVPFGGFSHLRGGDTEQKFTVCHDARADKRLPMASTCVNMLKLPTYDSKESLKSSLKLAIESCIGFGLV